MEEFVNVNGVQYKLTYDQPLTAEQKAQAIAEIKKQTGGCASGTCGQRSLNPRATYRGTQTLVSPITCPTGKLEGDTITLSANPDGGTAPYTVRFWRGTGTTTFPFTQVGTDQTVATDLGGPVTVSFTLTDTDIAAATGDAAAMEPDGVNTTTGEPTVSTTSSPLAAGAIRVLATTVDSCPTGAQTCIEWCDVTITCVAPTCNFVVT